MAIEALQPHTIENKLAELGFDSVKLQYEDDEWFIIFLTLNEYITFMTRVKDIETIGNIMMDQAESNIYPAFRDPLSFGVVIHIPRFEDWEDWQWFFQTLFTFMVV